MRKINPLTCKKAALQAGFDSEQEGLEVLRLFLHFRNNQEIYQEMKEKFSITNYKWNYPTTKRSIATFLRLYIFYNYEREFKVFAIANKCIIFGDDLEPKNKKNASSLRSMYLVFLREIHDMREIQDVKGAILASPSIREGFKPLS